MQLSNFKWIVSTHKDALNFKRNLFEYCLENNLRLLILYYRSSSSSSVTWLDMVDRSLHSSFTHLGWKLERYLFMHSVSWASKPGGVYPSPGQTTAEVWRHEYSPWSRLLIALWQTFHPGHWFLYRNPSTQQCCVITAVTAYIVMEPNLHHCPRWPLTLQVGSSTH